MRLVEDQIVQVAGDNDEMLDAVNDARESIGEFFKAFENPLPNQTDFHIKACFEDGTDAEHIWLSDIDFTTRPATGVVSNEPEIRSVSYMERVPFLPDQISDWMYREDGRLVGGFTTKVLLRAQSRQAELIALAGQKLPM